MLLQWFLVSSLLVSFCAGNQSSNLPENYRITAKSSSVRNSNKRTLLVPQEKLVSAGINVKENLFPERGLPAHLESKKFKRESNPAFNSHVDHPSHANGNNQPHLRIPADQQADDSILIGAIAGLPPPQTQKSLSGQNNSGPNRGATPRPFNRVTGSFFSQTSQPFGSQTHVLHNFPNNQDPKFKILEVKDNRARPVSSGAALSGQTHNRIPDFQRPAFPQRRLPARGSTVGNSVFVGTQGNNIPRSQSRFGDREGPIIVHRGVNEGGPALVHLNNRINHRLGRVGPLPSLGTFGRFRSPHNDPRIHFAFPSNLFPGSHHDNVAFHSAPVNSVVAPEDNQKDSLGLKKEEQNVEERKTQSPDRFRLAGVRRISTPRFSRQSPRPQQATASPRRIPHPTRSVGLNANRHRQPFFFHVDNHNTPTRRVPVQTRGDNHGSASSRPQFVQERRQPPREYSYGYAVDDRITGDQKKVYESKGVDGVVRGQYSLVQPDGLYRVVTYTADEQNGFRANVEYLPISGVPVSGK